MGMRINDESIVRKVVLLLRRCENSITYTSSQ